MSTGQRPDGKYIPLILAPMAGYTDAVFRTLCKKHGCDRTVTEMVSAKGLEYDNARTLELLETDPEERPVNVQIFGREPETLAGMACRLCEEMTGQIACIDINMGCPAKKITSNGEGSALMLEPLLAGRIMSAVVKASPVPVTVKMRLGWDDAHRNAVKLAHIAEESGISAVAVHGRTREQMYSGTADLAAIRAVKEAVTIPVIGNGDITGAESALTMLRETGCDGLMIGRGALGNPWIFSEIRAALDGTERSAPTPAERIETARAHLAETAEKKGRRGLLELRKHLCWYFRGMRGAARLRVLLQEAETAEDADRILKEVAETL